MGLTHSYKLHAFVLKRRNWGESDKIITFYSRETGKTTLIAKGIRKITSRRASALEIFNQVTFLAIRGKAMDIVTETQVDVSYHTLAQNYFKTTIAYQLMELVDKLTADNEAHEDVYILLQKAFTYIHDSEISREKMDAVLIRFKSRILELLGFGVPRIQTLEELTEYIESIVEKKLVAGKHFLV